jgi:heat shock protein HslJ
VLFLAYFNKKEPFHPWCVVKQNARKEKTVKKHFFTLLLIALAVSACAPPEPSASLIGAWNLTAYGPAASPAPAVADSGAQLTFSEDGTVTGNSGCNGFGGQYTVEGDQITFSEVVSTLIACEDARMAQEDAVLAVVTSTATFRIEGSTLTLTNNDTVLVFARGSYP